MIDKLTYAGRVENLPRGVALIPLDVSDFEHFLKVVEVYRPGVIFHLAAESHVDRSFRDPLAFTRTNVLGTHSVLEAGRRLGVRVVHVSTDEVYGPASDRPFSEDDPLRPTTPYAASKAAADLIAQSYIRSFGADVVVVRPSNAYGPRQHPEKLIPKTIIRLLLGMHVPIHGSGTQARTWTYVYDVAEALILLAEKAEPGVYNVASGEVRSVEYVVRKVAEFLGVEPRIVYVRDRPVQDPLYLLSTEKVSKLGWRPTVSFEEGLRETVRWYVENRWWWEPLVGDEYFRRDEP